jgi:hypothetical protein
MGRPIKKIYFANLNAPYQNHATGGNTGQGGEGIATVVNDNIATLYETGTYALSITAPQLGGGVQATATVSMVDGAVDSITITEAGTGYTSIPTVTLTSVATSGTTATFVATLTDIRANGIATNAWIAGGSSAKSSDIMKQEGSRRYLVVNSDGKGICKLVTAAPAEGEMTILATDANGSTYYVRKLSARRAILVQNVVNGAFEFQTNTAARWTLGSASTGVVSIANN